jgi:hypothetical protein
LAMTAARLPPLANRTSWPGQLPTRNDDRYIRT